MAKRITRRVRKQLNKYGLNFNQVEEWTYTTLGEYASENHNEEEQTLLEFLGKRNTLEISTLFIETNKKLFNADTLEIAYTLMPHTHNKFAKIKITNIKVAMK